MSDPNNAPTIEELTRENARLREELARAKAEAAEYKREAYRSLDEDYPYVTPTPEELHDMLHGPRGRPILEIVAELEKELGQEPK